jgi:hypothetical protein
MDDADGRVVEQQETDMNTQIQEINLLSDDELDAVAGGKSNSETEVFSVFLMGLASTCGAAGMQMLAGSFGAAQAAAGR